MCVNILETGVKNVKNVNNYYPILKFFKGFVLITKLGTVKAQLYRARDILASVMEGSKEHL